MTNREYFADKLLEIGVECATDIVRLAVVHDFPCSCDGTLCRDCDAYKLLDCDKFILEWLNKEREWGVEAFSLEELLGV